MEGWLMNIENPNTEAIPYSIAIATRNRVDALKLSIPRMLNQSRPPDQIVVVDSSDDHSIIRKIVDEATKDSGVQTTVIEWERGITKQRNRALQEIRNPIVFFPDDDSIWHPGVAEETMRVYELDTSREISAVCAAESKEPPSGFFEGDRPSYEMNTGDRMKLRFAKYRYRFENKFIPDPAKLLGRGFYEKVKYRSWMAEFDVVPVEWMTGFRMSFRTEKIKEVGFCKAFSNYSLFEDIDASFAVWNLGEVLAARKAKVFHYKSPERRDDAARLGFEQLLNKAFIVAKFSEKSHPCRRLMMRYARYKTLQYFLASLKGFGKQRYHGARNALRHLPRMMKAEQDQAEGVYRESLRAIEKK